eukprot:scaffold7571_cov18-Tisochrysis_lutea.AAC.3
MSPNWKARGLAVQFKHLPASISMKYESGQTEVTSCIGSLNVRALVDTPQEGIPARDKFLHG